MRYEKKFNGYGSSPVSLSFFPSSFRFAFFGFFFPLFEDFPSSPINSSNSSRDRVSWPSVRVVEVGMVEEVGEREGVCCGVEGGRGRVQHSTV
jgi:hypothetical protein